MTTKMEATKGRPSKSPPAIAFDPLRRAASDRLKSALSLLQAQLLAAERRIRRRTPRDRQKLFLAVEALVCNFLAARLMGGAEMALAVTRDNNAMWSGSRYQEPVYGAHFVAALDTMAEPALSWADCAAKGYRFADTGKGKLTAIRAMPALWDAVGLHDLDWSDMNRAAATEPLILRGPKVHRHGAGPALDYADTERTRKMRNEIQRINRLLEAAPLTLEGFPAADPRDRALRRTFNNGVWTDGGRLFGGFWQPMKRAERFRHLRIDGEAVAYVDFRQLFPTLLYFRSQLQPPDSDLYDVAGDRQHRAGWKALINAMLFARGPLRNWPDDTRELFPPGTELRKAVAAVIARHSPVAHHFGTGIGFRLMATESAIMVEALLRLFTAGITALPVHDAVLVGRYRAEQAAAILEETSEELTGHRAATETLESI